MDACGSKVRMSETPLRHDQQIENAENAALAVDSAGNRLVAWSDNSVGGRLHYNYFSVTEGAWSGDQLLPDVAPTGIRPCLESAGTGRFHLVWQGDDGRILHSLATDAGAPPMDLGFILAGNYGVRASASELPLLTVVCVADGGDRGEIERVELLMEGLPGGLPLARLPNGLYALLTPLPGGVGAGERLSFQLRAMDAAGLELLSWPELSAR